MTLGMLELSSLYRCRLSCHFVNRVDLDIWVEIFSSFFIIKLCFHVGRKDPYVVFCNSFWWGSLFEEPFMVAETLLNYVKGN